MKVEELIKNDSQLVRNSNELMGYYIKYSQELFNYSPNCAGCTFSSDWATFVNKVKLLKNINLKEIIMTKAFELRDTNKIYSIVEEGKHDRRCYGWNMTEDFAIEYLQIGTEEEIETKKLDFKTLPTFETTETEITETVKNKIEPKAKKKETENEILNLQTKTV
jgi:hypothetical protein